MKNENYAFTSQIITKVPQLLPYCDRIERIRFLYEVLKLDKLVKHMFDHTQSTDVSINRIIEYTRQICIFKAISTERSFILTFNKGFLSPAFTLNRAIFELWAAAFFTKTTIEEFSNTRNHDKFSNIVQRLFTGSIYPTQSYLGEQSTERPIRVSKLIKHLEEYHPGTQQTYDFMCEYSHPNYILNAYANFATLNSGLWNNPKFFKDISMVLEKQLASLENSLLGIKDSVGAITQICYREYSIKPD